ncbi:ferritin-like domain-containing protein [Thermococcus sp.]
MIETESERLLQVLSALSPLSEKELLSYWIRGEYEEAETYWKLAERAKELGLPEEVIETFIVLAKESREHGNRLREIYMRSYRENPIEVDIPGLEAEMLRLEMDTPGDILDVLVKAMETELFAKALYEKLAAETNSASLRKVYLYLAEIERGHYESLKCELEVCKKIYEKS